MSDLRGVLFDKDGTLFDFALTWEAWANGLLSRLATNSDHKTALAQAIGYDLLSGHFEPDSVVIAGTPAEVALNLAPYFPTKSLDNLIDLLNQEASAAPQMEAVPLVPFLSALKNDGFALGVATNDAEAPARAHLDKAKVSNLFDFIAGFDSGHGSKPQPGQLMAFAHAVDLAPSSIVMVGDSLHDLVAGRAAGMKCVGVLTGMATSDDLAPFADQILPDIGSLPAWMAQQV